MLCSVGLFWAWWWDIIFKNKCTVVIIVAFLLGKKQEADELSGDASVEDYSLVKVITNGAWKNAQWVQIGWNLTVT